MIAHWLIPNLKRDFPKCIILAVYDANGVMVSPEKLDLTVEQDGASAHRAYATVDYLTRRFTGVISNSYAHRNPTSKVQAAYLARWNVETQLRMWPAHSPDLTPVDFYLWESIKLRV